MKSSKVVSSSELVKIASRRNKNRGPWSVESNKLVKSREHLKSSELVKSSVRKKNKGA